MIPVGKLGEARLGEARLGEARLGYVNLNDLKLKFQSQGGFSCKVRLIG